MKTLKKVLRVLVMIPLSFCAGFGLILAFFVGAAIIANGVEIWLEAEWFFQVIAALFLMASTGVNPTRPAT